jgi:hypothetical protein
MPMMKLIFSIFGLGIAALFTGCQSPVMISRAVVYNHTPASIQDVSVKHFPTQKSASVSAILPNQTLQIEVGSREMLADSAVVQWNASGSLHKVPLQIPKVNPDPDDRGLTLVYEIKPGGRASVYFLDADDR